ncbi:hypothetical protein Tco_0891911 [Tanacetum coccineum]|uniref:Uncharacterized protein n=1 Tax=Tanacetum coccineum TaxID=301880 RepID=A0ABQ5C9Q1_9ASTR
MLEINDLTSQLQDKSIGNAEIREMLNKMKGKHVKTTFVRPYVVRQLRVIHNTSFSRPQLRSTPMQDKIVQNNSQVMLKKNEVKDHHMISKFSNNTKSITACNDTLNAKTSNVKFVYVTFDIFIFNANPDDCVSKYINDLNARTKKPHAVPISTRKPTRTENQSIATSLRK